MSEIKTKKVKLDKLKPHPKNPKMHQVQRIDESIGEFGMVEPIVVDEENTIISGHGRLKALKARGEEDTEVIVKEGLTEEQKEKYLVLGNKLVEAGGWSEEALMEYEQEVLAEVGFTSQELDAIYNFSSDEDGFNPEDDEEPEPETEKGDIYQLGEHRLMCGDSTSKEDVEKLMDGKKADMVFTDPPYNMDYEGKQGKILGDNQPEEEFIQFSIEFIARMREASRAGAAFYVCSGYDSYIPFVYAMQANGLKFANPIIWVKNMLGLGQNDYRHKHEMAIKVKNKGKSNTGEPILYGWKEGEHYFRDTRAEADVWNIKKKATSSMVHPTQKPVKLIRRAIRNSTKRGELILDLFGGSGSTLVAADKDDRSAYLMELDPKYCDVIKARYENLTGEAAKKVN